MLIPSPQIELENLVAKGLKLDAITSLLPDKGTKSATLNAVYKQSGVHTRAALDVFKVSWSTARCFPATPVPGVA